VNQSQSANPEQRDDSPIPRRAKGIRADGGMARLHVELPILIAVELRHACASRRITLATATEEAVRSWLKK